MNENHLSIESSEPEIIYYKPGTVRDYPNGPKRAGFKFAWKESMKAKIWGWAPTLEEVKRCAARLFPGLNVKFVAL